MRSLLLTVLLVSGLFISAQAYENTPEYRDNLKKDLNSLSLNQREQLARTFVDSKNVTNNKTERLLISAIAWKESSFGEKLESSTHDYGVYMINIHSFKDRFKDEIKRLHLTDKQVKNFLKQNHNIGLQASYAEIQYWKKRYNGDMFKVIASYNAGNNGTSSVGKDYARDVILRMALLNSYLKERMI